MLHFCARCSAVQVATVPRWSSIVRPSRSPPKLERPQEVDDILLLLSGQPIETVDDLICLAILAPVGFDSLNEIACTSVMEEKNALPDAPERSCSKLIGTCATLRDAVRKISTHVVDEDVGEEIHGFVGERCTRVRRGAAGNHLAGGKRRCVAVDTTYLCENGPPIHRGRRVGRRSGRGQHPH